MLGRAAAVAVRGRGGRHLGATPLLLLPRRVLVSVETVESEITEEPQGALLGPADANAATTRTADSRWGERNPSRKQHLVLGNSRE